MTDHKCTVVSVFWHCISVFANFSHGIALLGTPQFPPLYNLDNLWLMSSMLHRVIKLPPVKWVRMSLEESLINMVSSMNIQFSKPIGTGGYTCKIRKIWNTELYGWFFRLVEGCPGAATHFFPMNLKYQLLNNCTESEIVDCHKRIAHIIHQQLNKNTMKLMTQKHFVYN